MTVPRFLKFSALCLGLCLLARNGHAETLLIEAESFDHPGGWVLDTQFIKAMGSPYLLAHGMGVPVPDATTRVKIPAAGKYHVFVRTKDWVARWKAPGQPGRFQLVIDRVPLETTFGTTGAQWHWQPGGEIELPAGEIVLSLHDLTGFEGRCDAIVLTTEATPPPEESAALAAWRLKTLNLEANPIQKDGYDLIVVGGGYSGMGAALAAARMGCKVALIQDRPVLGGNGSSEVRVWAQGLIRRGKYPRIGEIIEEFCDHAKKSPGTAQEFEDEKKEFIVRSEKNIDLYLNHHADKVDMDEERIVSVYAFDTRTSQRTRFSGNLFCDATGHGALGALAAADYDQSEKGRMGMSNMWRWDESAFVLKFPETPWALDLTMDDFPYPREHHAEWFWESGFDKDPIHDAEGIRDWNFRAIYGAFNAMKNRDGAKDHKHAYLTWIAYIGGPRESRRLLGDVVLNQDDVVSKKQFKDGCVPSTWSIDLHYPKQQYAEKFPDNPFISMAKFDRSVDRDFGYPLPYRCFYSRNVPNLFMAGRCISVTHEALGTVRVMKTCGMMGEVVGKAASLCTIYACQPRDIYERYWPEMDQLLQLPGKAYRATVRDEIIIPADALTSAGPNGPVPGVDPAKLEGVVLDNRDAKLEGNWTKGHGLPFYVGYEYVYASANSGAKATFEWIAGEPAQVEIRLAYQNHENRGASVPVQVTVAGKSTEKRVNMQVPPPSDDLFISLGEYSVQKGDRVSVVIGTKDAQGAAHVDAVQIRNVK